MPKSLENLTVHAFRGIRELDLLDVGRINLLVGANNCGKTSVLEAIATFCHPLDIREWFSAARRREIKSSREPLYEAVHWLFPRARGGAQNSFFHGETAISADGGSFAVLKASAQCEEMIEYDEQDDGAQHDELTSSDERVTELNLSARVAPHAWLQYHADPTSHLISHVFSVWHGRPFTSRAPPEHPCLPVATVSPFAHRVEQLQIGQLTELALSDRKNEVREVLRMFDDDVVDLEILSRDGSRPTIYIMHERLGRAPLNIFGDGMRRALVIAMSLVSVEHGVLLIDEVEASIHTSVLESVFEWLVRACVEYDVQLFATTHSLEAVDAMLFGGQIDLNEVVGYHIESLPEKTAARRYSGDLLRRLREERGLDVR